MRTRSAEAANPWDGCGTGENVYNEKEDKRYQSSIWKYLFGVAALMLAFVIFNHGRELNVIWNGTSIEAEYYLGDSGRPMARYYDENGQLYIYQISATRAVHGENTITMYYTDTPRDAIFASTWISWAGYYVFFGVILAISLWRIIIIYKKQA